MDYKALQQKKDFVIGNKNLLSDVTTQSLEQAFSVAFTHNSTAIEGNTLSLIETKTVLEDGISIGGKELREIYEVVNHAKAFEYVKLCLADNKPLDERIVKDIHAILMENIIVGGVYRSIDVYISGAGHTPPTPNDMYRQIKYFFDDLSCKTQLSPIELAAWTHAEFVRIHPFSDGNGRTSRLIMNYQLMSAGFLPISITKEQRLDYYNALEEYAVKGNLSHFTDMISVCENERLEQYLRLIAQANAVQPDIMR